MSDKGNPYLEVKLYGAPDVRRTGDVCLRIAGARNHGLIALLATSPGMRRSRSWLVDTLWSGSAPDRGRANLRQLLHALRQTMGTDFDRFFDSDREAVSLKSEQINLVGGPQDGIFLEGLDLPQEGFESWLRQHRASQPPALTDTLPETVSDNLSILPRILVTPFTELAQNAPTGIGDALAQELTGHFARSQLINAISHFSSRQPAGSGKDTTLEAEFALTGQCRVFDDTLTVDATLIDLKNGKVLWSDRQKIRMQDFLRGEDFLTNQIAGQSLRILMSRSIGSSSSTPLPELPAHTLLISAVALMHSFEKRHFHQAKSLLDEVIRRAPGHSVPRAWLAQWHLLRVYQKWSDAAANDQRHATDAIKNALDLNAACPLALSIDGNIHTVLCPDFNIAKQRFEAARAINPSSAFNAQLHAVLATFNGDGQAAVDLTDRAFMLSPRDPRRTFFQTLSAGSYVAGGRYNEAVDMAEASLRQNPLHLSAHRCRVIGLQLAGREGEARQAATELLRLDPGLRVSAYLRDHPAAQSGVSQIWADALKDAGVPVN